MKRTSIIVIAVVAVVMLIIVASGLFIADETQQVVVTRLGKPVRTILNPGLHFKIPFLEPLMFLINDFWNGVENRIRSPQRINVISGPILTPVGTS